MNLTFQNGYPIYLWPFFRLLLQKNKTQSNLVFKIKEKGPVFVNMSYFMRRIYNFLIRQWQNDLQDGRAVFLISIVAFCFCGSTWRPHVITLSIKGKIIDRLIDPIKFHRYLQNSRQSKEVSHRTFTPILNACRISNGFFWQLIVGSINFCANTRTYHFQVR